MLFEVLTDDNLELFAARHYDNATCLTIDEFHADMAKPKYLYRLFAKYERTGNLKERLILNHLIAFFNVFETEAGARILFFSIDKKYWSILKTFLVFIDRCPVKLIGVPETVYTSDISLDMKVVKILRGV